MENPAYILLSRTTVLRSQMEVLANNLANMNTPGYRSEQLLFNEFLSPKATNPGLRGDGARVSFVGLGGTLTDTREGPLENTGNQMDLALQGEGFFVVQTPDGARYTRDGHFSADQQGQIVTRDGFPVLDTGNRPMTVPSGTTSIEVTASGRISSDKGQVGSLQVVKFANGVALQKAGVNLYQTDGTPQPVDATTKVQQGMIEQSNVQPVIEISKMVELQRAYEAASQMVTNEHDRGLKAIEVLTKTS